MWFRQVFVSEGSTRLTLGSRLSLETYDMPPTTIAITRSLDTQMVYIANVGALIHACAAN